MPAISETEYVRFSSLLATAVLLVSSAAMITPFRSQSEMQHGPQCKVIIPYPTLARIDFLDTCLPKPAHFLRPYQAAYLQAAAVRHFACGRARLQERHGTLSAETCITSGGKL
jgi:hypothetical protein